MDTPAMETKPMPLGGLVRGQPGDSSGIDEFRVGDVREVAAMMRRLVDAGAPLQLHADGGTIGSVPAMLWASDPDRGRLSFAVDGTDVRLPTLLAAAGLTVVGYLDHVKIQFETDQQVLTTGPQGSVVRCAWPTELYRFQRRNAYRVRPATARAMPVARLRHTDIAEMQLALRVLDVSIGGCALFLPQDVPAMQIGGTLNQVRLELEDDVSLAVDLRLQHVTSAGPDAGGVRLGCEFVRCDASAQRTLQRYIDLTQKRGRGFLSLD